MSAQGEIIANTLNHHHGSARMVTDQNANIIARHDYAPFWAGDSEWRGSADERVGRER
jgi:hypothetical protein